MKALQKKIVKMCLESKNGGIVPGMATFALGVRGGQTRRALKNLRRQGMMTSIPAHRQNSRRSIHPGTLVHVWTIDKAKRGEARHYAGIQP